MRSNKLAFLINFNVVTYANGLFIKPKMKMVCTSNSGHFIKHFSSTQKLFGLR